MNQLDLDVDQKSFRRTKIISESDVAPDPGPDRPPFLEIVWPQFDISIHFISFIEIPTSTVMTMDGPRTVLMRTLY